MNSTWNDIPRIFNGFYKITYYPCYMLSCTRIRNTHKEIRKRGTLKIQRLITCISTNMVTANEQIIQRNFERQGSSWIG